MHSMLDEQSVTPGTAEAYALHPNPSWRSKKGSHSFLAGTPEWEEFMIKRRQRLDYIHLPRKPLFDDRDIFTPRWVPIRLEVQKGVVVVLCPVNRLNDIPRRFPLKVQADYLVENNLVNNTALLTDTGRVYSWAQDTI